MLMEIFTHEKLERKSLEMWKANEAKKYAHGSFSQCFALNCRENLKFIVISRISCQFSENKSVCIKTIRFCWCRFKIVMSFWTINFLSVNKLNNWDVDNKMGFKSAAKTFRRHHVEETPRFPTPRYNIFMCFYLNNHHKEQKSPIFIYLWFIGNLF